ncbi:MAG: magnesium/cobalt transporter CorA [Desulfuromonadales bacterium]
MPRKLIRKRGKPAGSAPGTLIHVGEKRTERVRLHYIDYDAHQLEEQDVAADEAAACCALKDRPSVSWINVDGIHNPATIQTIGDCFSLHPLVQEDILNTDHRPKFEAFDDYAFIVLKMPFYDQERREVRTEQVSLILGNRFVLSFQEKEGDVFDKIRDRLRNNKGRIRKLGADYLAYALIDAVVDHYFSILEQIGDQIEDLEDELILEPDQETLHAIHNFKREMILLRKSVWPLRELISGLQRDESDLISDTTKIYLRDVYDHTIQVIDTVETFRDIIAGMLDLYLSSLSNRMNEVMKVLTIMATIFIPLTFLAGVYGMNFHYMPELTWRWSYPAFWLIMIAISLGLFVAFKRRKWL